MLFLQSPILLCLVFYDKHSLLEPLVDALMENTHHKDITFLRLLEDTGEYTQHLAPESKVKAELKGVHWNKQIRGMTVVALKLLSDQIDRNLVA